MAEAAWLALFAVAVAASQLWSYGAEFLNYDEYTFILMSEQVLRGHLPYTELIDNKPPGLFFLMAGWMALFGGSWTSVRLMGDAAILASAWMVFAIARACVPVLPAAFAALALVSMQVLGDLSNTNSEGIAIVPFLGAVLLLISGRVRDRDFAAVGLLMAAAVLVRSNLVYPTVAIGVWITVAGWLRARSLRPMLAYTLGGLVLPVLLVGVYLADGTLDRMILGAVTVPLSYASEQEPAWVVAGKTVSLFYGLTGDYIASRAVQVVLALAVLGLLGLALARYADRGKAALIVMVMLATLYSIFASGVFYPHHAGQVVPFFAILGAIGISALFGRLAPAVSVAGMLAAAAFILAVRGGADLAVASGEAEVIDHGQRWRVAEAIRGAMAPGDEVFALNGHIVYHFLGIRPPRPYAVHPDTITRPVIIGPMIEAGVAEADPLASILADRPRFIVTDLPELPVYITRAMPEFGDWLAAEYHLLHAEPGTAVYERNPG